MVPQGQIETPQGPQNALGSVRHGETGEPREERQFLGARPGGAASQLGGDTGAAGRSGRRRSARELAAGKAAVLRGDGGSDPPGHIGRARPGGRGHRDTVGIFRGTGRAAHGGKERARVHSKAGGRGTGAHGDQEPQGGLQQGVRLLHRGDQAQPVAGAFGISAAADPDRR